MLKFVLVCVMFCPLVMVVFVFPNCVHVPELFHIHVAFIVSCVSLSPHVTYSLGVGHILFCWFVGDAPVWYGIWFVLVVKWYVLFVQLHPSVRLTLQ